MITRDIYANALIEAGREGINNKFSKDCWRKRIKVICKQLKIMKIMQINQKNFVLPSKKLSPQPSLNGMRVHLSSLTELNCKRGL